MIQRIQTVWLVLAAFSAAMGGIMLGNVVNGVPGNTAVTPTMEEWLALGVFSVVGVLSVLAVVLFQQRNRQRKLILAAQYLALLGIVGVFYQIFVRADVALAQLAPWNMWLGPALAVATYPLLWLARRGVEADIKLLQSVDRLR